MNDRRNHKFGRTLGLGCLAAVIFSATSCKKKTPPFDIDAGTAAQFFGLTTGASSWVNLYTVRYKNWAPDSPFCRGV